MKALIIPRSIIVALLPLLGTLLGASILTVPWAAAQEDDGHALALSVFERPDGADAVVMGTMTLNSGDRLPRVREFHSFRREDDDSNSVTLIRFQAPANIAGTALLDDPGEDGVWLYLPALDRVRRISSANRGGRFVNSQIFYEDLRERHPDEDRHRLLGQGDYEGVGALMLESVPGPDTESAYSKRVSWIHPDLLLPLRVDFYDGGDTPVKRMTVQRIDDIDGIWTVTGSVMEDLDSGDSTVMTVERVSYDQGLPAGLFTTSTLKNPDQESDYLP